MTKQTNDRATGRPWGISSSNMIFSKNKLVASCVSIGVAELDPSPEETIANAQLIVKAVNSYDAMREVLQAIVDYDESTPLRKPYTDTVYKPLTNLLRDKAKQALESCGEV